ncbi:DUF3990 domain-containing protein [Blautia marasmi]|uniref:DUF3990 domain-containing protein n=1 Tax=Blautia marasmi TaxID=1917868 RepID=UPI001D0774F2|nr:DUF3990 domain-containing protein [Blautia marasmi]MCB6191866.1 DUF3990 domain-containing protein [Blautia marasmi]
MRRRQEKLKSKSINTCIFCPSILDCNLDFKYDIVAGPVANDTVGLLIRQFSRGTIDAEYLKKEFDFGKLTNQYTFHTEKALQYLKKVGVMHDKSAAGND